MGDDHAVTEECMDVGEEGRGLRVRVRRREQPTAEEVREHNVLHHPYRSWCPWCVGARAPDRQHREANNNEDSRLRSEVALDYAFLRDTAKGPSATLPAGKDRRTGTFIGHIVPFKGAGLTWVVEQLIRDFRRLGYYGEVTLRGDQEPAIRDLLKAVAEHRAPAHTVVEHSPAYDSRANGFVERSVRSLEEMIRTHKLALESRVKAKIPVEHKIMAWVVEFATDVLNKFLVGRDGRTAYERTKGKKFRGEVFRFAQPIMLRVAGPP